MALQSMAAIIKGCGTPLNTQQEITPLCAELSGYRKIYLHLISCLHTETAQVVDILSHGRQGSDYMIQSIPWLMMTW